jgi:hypothetical protein
MLFRRRSRSHDAPVVQIVGDCSVRVSPTTTATKSNKPIALGESFVLSASHLLSSHNRGGSSDEGYQSNSSPDASPPQRKAPTPKRFPISRKTGFATIQTEPTDTQPAFESDAFAVLMPTTRLPILDHPISRAKMASPAARAEALRTYEEKAQRNRERNDSQGVKVPSQMKSYDYAARYSPEVEVRTPTPAGTFPISPPLPQHTWARAERATEAKVGASRHVNNLSTTTTVPKPLNMNTNTTTATPTTSRYRVYRADSTAGASRSPCAASALPPTITVRIKSKPKVVTKDALHVHTKSTHNLYNLPYDVSPPSSRSPSPVKTMPNFTRHNSVEGDSIFGYNSKDIDGAVAGASPTTSGSEKENGEIKTKYQAKPKIAEKTTTPKRTLTSRWPWLRPVSPRIAKPTTTPVVFSTPPPPPSQPPPPPSPTTAVPKPTPRPTSGYVDPFERHATPPAPTPAPTPIPKKVIAKPPPKSATPAPKPAPKSTPTPKSTTPSLPSTPKFDTGFAQIQSLGLIMLKFCFALYALVALWFVLDAMREAIHTVGIPFRAVKWVGGWGWAGVCWVGRVVGAVGGRR